MKQGTHQGVTVAAVTLTAAVTALTALDVQTPARVATALAFVLLVPGWAVVGLLRLADPVGELVVSITLSLALGILVAQVLVWWNAYSVELTFGVLAASSMVGLVAQLVLTDRSRAMATEARSTDRARSDSGA